MDTLYFLLSNSTNFLLKVDIIKPPATITNNIKLIIHIGVSIKFVPLPNIARLLRAIVTTAVHRTYRRSLIIFIPPHSLLYALLAKFLDLFLYVMKNKATIHKLFLQTNIFQSLLLNLNVLFQLSYF